MPRLSLFFPLLHPPPNTQSASHFPLCRCRSSCSCVFHYAIAASQQTSSQERKDERTTLRYRIPIKMSRQQLLPPSSGIQEASSRHKTPKPIFSLSTSSALCLYALNKLNISNLKCAHAWSPKQYLGLNGSQFTWLRHAISGHRNSDLRVLTRYSILPANILLCPPCRYILCICPDYVLEIYFHVY
jgi:hypothetical protein